MFEIPFELIFGLIILAIVLSINFVPKDKIKVNLKIPSFSFSRRDVEKKIEEIDKKLEEQKRWSKNSRLREICFRKCKQRMKLKKECNSL